LIASSARLEEGVGGTQEDLREKAKFFRGLAKKSGGGELEDGAQ